LGAALPSTTGALPAGGALVGGALRAGAFATAGALSLDRAAPVAAVLFSRGAPTALVSRGAAGCWGFSVTGVGVSFAACDGELEGAGADTRLITLFLTV